MIWSTILVSEVMNFTWMVTIWIPPSHASQKNDATTNWLIGQLQFIQSKVQSVHLTSSKGWIKFNVSSILNRTEYAHQINEVLTDEHHVLLFKVIQCENLMTTNYWNIFFYRLKYTSFELRTIILNTVSYTNVLKISNTHCFKGPNSSFSM